jgi:hypothetical protein
MLTSFFPMKNFYFTLDFGLWGEVTEYGVDIFYIGFFSLGNEEGWCGW